MSLEEKFTSQGRKMDELKAKLEEAVEAVKAARQMKRDPVQNLLLDFPEQLGGAGLVAVKGRAVDVRLLADRRYGDPGQLCPL